MWCLYFEICLSFPICVTSVRLEMRYKKSIMITVQNRSKFWPHLFHFKHPNPTWDMLIRKSIAHVYMEVDQGQKKIGLAESWSRFGAIFLDYKQLNGNVLLFLRKARTCEIKTSCAYKINERYAQRPREWNVTNCWPYDLIIVK